MSYRTRVNDTQIFGNNESYPEWIEFIQSQGIEINEEGIYEGEIADFMQALVVIETIIMRLEKERRERRVEFEKELVEKDWSEEEKEYARNHIYGIKSLFDWKNTYNKVEKDRDDNYGTSLLDELFSIADESYAFMPYQFFKACEDSLEKDHCFSTPGHFHCYKLKEGETIKVSAS